jgi:hypothetical protein
MLYLGIDQHAKQLPRRDARATQEATGQGLEVILFVNQHVADDHRQSSHHGNARDLAATTVLDRLVHRVVLFKLTWLVGQRHFGI